MVHSDEILATVSASQGRRWIGVLSLAFLGFLLIWIAFARPPALLWQVFLLALGAGALFAADKMRQATALVIELTRHELRDSSGTVIARLDNIQSIDRGFFAFKPSNGFLLRIAKPEGGRNWQPGIWWRVGRRIGVGGVTPGYQTKPMTEIIAAILAERDEH